LARPSRYDSTTFGRGRRWHRAWAAAGSPNRHTQHEEEPMKTVWTVITTAGVVTAVCLFLGGPITQAQGPTPPLYGVVDLADVMREYNAVKEMREKLEKRAEDFKKETTARRQKIDEVRFSRDQEHPDSPKWFELQSELNRLSVEMELWTKFQQQDIQAESREQQNRVYKDMLRAVETVAKQRGLNAVFHLDGVDLNDPNDVLTAQRMTTRAVIYASPTIDLTKDVIARINQAGGK
jgi:Skp family chaperone for outer membrane proteins